MKKILKNNLRFLFFFIAITISTSLNAQSLPYWADLDSSIMPLGSDNENIYYESRTTSYITLYKWNPVDGPSAIGGFYIATDPWYITQVVRKEDCLYAIGSFVFTLPNSTIATNIAKYNLSSGEWSSLGYMTPGPNFDYGEINSVAVDNQTNVYVGLWYFGEDDIATNILRKFDGTQWSSVGGGLKIYHGPGPEGPNEADRLIWRLATDGTNVFVLGGFQGGYNGANYVHSPLLIKWDGTQWDSMGGLTEVGIDGYWDISTHGWLAVLGTNLFVSHTIVDSAFDVANGNTQVSSVGISRFSTATGQLLPCDSLSLAGNQGFGEAVVVHDGTIYLDGSFDHVGSTVAYGIAKWTSGTANWTSVGGGLSYQSNPGAGNYALGAISNAVIVNGIFDEAGTTSINYGNSALFVTGPIPPPVVTSAGLSGGVYAFTIKGMPGSTWQVHRDQGWGSWDNIGSVTLDGFGSGTFTDSSIGDLLNYEDVTAGYYQLSGYGMTVGTFGFNIVTLPASGDGVVQWITNPFYYPDPSINSVIPAGAFSGADITGGALFVDVPDPEDWTDSGDIVNQGDGWYWEEAGVGIIYVSAADVPFGSGNSLQFNNGTGYDVTFILQGFGYVARDN